MLVDCFENGTYQLVDPNETLHASRVNGLQLKKYFPRHMLVVKDDVSKVEAIVDTSVVYQDSSLNTLSFANHE